LRRYHRTERDDCRPGNLETWKASTEADLKDICEIISQVKLLMSLSIDGGRLSIISLIVTITTLASLLRRNNLPRIERGYHGWCGLPRNFLKVNQRKSVETTSSAFYFITLKGQRAGDAGRLAQAGW